MRARGTSERYLSLSPHLSSRDVGNIITTSCSVGRMRGRMAWRYVSVLSLDISMILAFSTCEPVFYSLIPTSTYTHTSMSHTSIPMGGATRFIMLRNSTAFDRSLFVTMTAHSLRGI